MQKQEQDVAASDMEKQLVLPFSTSKLGIHKFPQRSDVHSAGEMNYLLSPDENLMQIIPESVGERKHKLAVT